MSRSSQPKDKPAEPAVLMYHDITAGVPGDRYAVTAASLEKHLDGLIAASLPIVRTDALTGSRKGVTITIDDGLEQALQVGLPVLTERHCAATVFVIADRLGQAGYASVAALRAWTEHGMLVGSHGCSHVALSSLSESEARRELSVSKDRLEEALGVEVTDFSLPFGAGRAREVAMARSVGYQRVFCSRPVHGRTSSADAGHPRGARLVQRFGVTTLPTMLVIAPDGRVDDALIGYITPQAFAAEMQRIQGGQGTVGALRARLEEQPEDLQRMLDLAVKLQQVGAAEESKALLEGIRERDPAGETVVGAQLKLWDVQNAITGAAADPADATTLDLTPLYEHLPKIQPEPIRFQAWDWLARIENQRGERAKACRAYEEAWRYIPEPAVGDWGFTLVDLYWGMRDELTEGDRAFVLEVATRVAARVEAMVEAEPAERFGMDDEAFAGYHAEVLDLLARAQFMGGDATTALGTLERALELDPDNGELRARLETLRAPRSAKR